MATQLTSVAGRVRVHEYVRGLVPPSWAGGVTGQGGAQGGPGAHTTPCWQDRPAWVG